MIISKKNEVHLVIETEPSIGRELSDFFTFEVPGARFMPQYKSRVWDGKIRLFNQINGELYVGLLPYIEEFAKRNDIEIEYKEGVKDERPIQGVDRFIGRVSPKSNGKTLEIRDYQMDAILHAIRNNRSLLLSPTASGKSLIIYILSVWYAAQTEKNVLILVPTTSLVEQMFKDFQDYGWNAEDFCHRIYSGREKTNEFPVVITTWQSIYKLPRGFYDAFDVVIGDEAHQFKSKSLVNIMTKLADAKYRFGFTGTLDGTQTHKWVLEGLFGPSYKVTQTKELIDKGHLSKLQIKIIILKHNPQEFEAFEDEVQFIIQHQKRNNFIKNLALDLKGNTLVLFQRVETHGQPLYESINSSVKDGRKVFYVHGGVDAEEREYIRAITEKENNAIIVASYGTFSTGINIKNLHNVIFASPSKSRIRNLQSIGRVLRKGDNKTQAVLYDIADDCTKNSRKNYTLNHLIERVKIYNEENFNYEFIQVNLKE